MMFDEKVVLVWPGLYDTEQGSKQGYLEKWEISIRSQKPRNDRKN